MSGLLYYLPAGVLTPEQFVASRARAFGPAPLIEQRGVTGGPDGGDGVILAVGPHDGRVAYLKDAQDWQPAPAPQCAAGPTAGTAPSWWLGFDRASPPTPADLARPEMLRGRAVALGDGRDWTIPAARLWVEQECAAVPVNGLPQQLALANQGGLTMLPLPQWRPLSDAGMRVWSGLQFSEKRISINLPLDDEWTIAIDALAANYRLGAEEVSALGLVTTSNLASILLALVDFDGFLAVLNALEEAASKKDHAGTSAGSVTASGETDSRPATPPASPISNCT